MDKLFKRKLSQTLAKYAPWKEMIVIRGPRQSGKTTLLKQIADGTAGDRLFVNLEDPTYRRQLEDGPLDFVRRFKGAEKLTLFLDEVQRAHGSGEKLKLIFDEFGQGVKLYVSGSSSMEIRSNVLQHLVGRALVFDLLTMSFEEFVQAKDEGLYRIYEDKHGSLMEFIHGEAETIGEPAFAGDLLKLWKEYAIYGGYPEVVKKEDPEDKEAILRNIYRLYIQDDIASYFGITDSRKFEDFVRLSAFNAGNIFLLESAAQALGIARTRAEGFLSVLTNTFIAELVRPYYRNLSTELKKAPKVYFFDMGLRNQAIGNFVPFDNREDQGRIAENFVFRELLDVGRSIRYWRTTSKGEVDFVLLMNDEVLPVEVKLGGGNLGRSYHSFIDAYRPSKGLMITMDKFGQERVGNTVVYHVPIFYL